MKMNMGILDRSLRIGLAVLGGALYGMGFIEGTLGYVILGLGAVFIMTSSVGFCHLYLPLKISTKKVE
jgi:hypothetical protein